MSMFSEEFSNNFKSGSQTSKNAVASRHKKMKFSIKDFFSKDFFVGSCGFGHIYRRNS